MTNKDLYNLLVSQKADTDARFDGIQAQLGGQDEKFLALARELSTLMPHARISVAQNAGHDLILERPALCSAYLLKGIM